MEGGIEHTVLCAQSHSWDAEWLQDGPAVSMEADEPQRLDLEFEKQPEKGRPLSR